MNYLGIHYQIKNQPKLDTAFIPLGKWMTAFLSDATHPVRIGVEREDQLISVFDTFIHNTPEFRNADFRYLERVIKFLLWSKGGFRIYLYGADSFVDELSRLYSYDESDDTQNGERWFDVQFMSDVYQKHLEVVACESLSDFPSENETSDSFGGNYGGNRIGIDLGGSDIKISSLENGELVYADEIVWHPKDYEDCSYHFDTIVSVLKNAEKKLSTVDSVGMSTAGVLIGNAPMVSSLFIKVSRNPVVRKEVHTIFDRAVQEIGDGNVPLVVANDGDVAALSAAMEFDKRSVLGLAFGTSLAGGYVDDERRVRGWFNELAFAPVDLNEQAPIDPWSHDRGVGCEYLSQDAVARLFDEELPSDSMTKAEILTHVQTQLQQGNATAHAVFETMGTYLAHILYLYHLFYDYSCVILLGRVMSGLSGEVILQTCENVMQSEYPELFNEIELLLPEESMRRVGQSIAAASLPE